MERDRGGKERTPHPSPLTPHPSPLTPHPSPLTPHPSPLTPHPSPLTPHPSPLTPHPEWGEGTEMIQQAARGRISHASFFAGYGWAGRLVGVLLLAAAGAKLYGWNYQPVSETAWLATPGVRVASVVLEGLLGLWLLTGLAPIRSWLAALGTFAFFAGVSLQWVARRRLLRLLRGDYGKSLAHVRTRYRGAVPVGRVPAEMGRPFRGGTGLKGMAKGAIGVVVLAVGLLGLGRFFFTSPQEAAAFLRGEQITVDQTTVDLGVGQNGEWKTGKATVQNLSARPVRIVGGHADCSCVVAEELPVAIGPGAKAEIPFRLHYPASSTGQFWKEVRMLITDDPSQGPLVLLLVGRVVPKQ